MPLSPEERVKIDSQKFRNWCANNHHSFKEISEAMGYSDCFISKAVSAGEMPERKFKLFLTLYGEDARTFLPDGEPKIMEPANLQQGPYSLGLEVKSDRVQVSIYFQGMELYSAYAGIKGKTELDLIQSISYAAHMCYKMAEQRRFKNG
jgi:hypothetical protein